MGHEYLALLKRLDLYVDLILESIVNKKNMVTWINTLPKVSRYITNHHLMEFSANFVYTLRESGEVAKRYHASGRDPLTEYIESLRALRLDENPIPLLIFLFRYPKTEKYLSEHLCELEHVNNMWLSSPFAGQKPHIIPEGNENRNWAEIKTSFVDRLESMTRIGNILDSRDGEGVVQDSTGDCVADGTGDCVPDRERLRSWDFPMLIKDLRKDLVDIHSTLMEDVEKGAKAGQGLYEAFYDGLESWCSSLGWILSCFVEDVYFSIEVIGKLSSLPPQLESKGRSIYKEELKKLRDDFGPLLKQALTYYAISSESETDSSGSYESSQSSDEKQ